MVSGAKSLEFLGSQTTPVLANLVLLWRDSLLLDVRSTVPAEELSRLRHALLPPSSALFPLTLLDTALSKTLTTSNGALVHKALHPPRIPKCQLQGQNRSSSLAASWRIGPGSRPSFPVNDRRRTATPLLPPRQEAIPVNPARGRSHFATPWADPATREAVVKAPVSVRPDEVAAPTQVGAGGVCHCIGDSGRQ